jgi:hypothetical protein
MQARERWWFGATAFAVALGVIVQLFVTADLKTGFFDTSTKRALNVFCFFTVQSNLIVGATTVLLALKPRRSSVAFDTFRLTGVVAIAITGIVYHAVLSKLFDLESWALVADNLLHTVVPVMGVAGWLMFGPRGRASRRVMWLSVLFPVAWLVFTLLRGAGVGFYPYPFIDVAHLGYGRVLVNCVWVAVLYLGVAAGFTALDGWLVRVRST